MCVRSRRLPPGGFALSSATDRKNGTRGKITRIYETFILKVKKKKKKRRRNIVETTTTSAAATAAVQAVEVILKKKNRTSLQDKTDAKAERSVR